MMNPLALRTRTGCRVTPLFRCLCARRPLLPPHLPAQSRAEWLPSICRLGRSNGSKAIDGISTVVSGSEWRGPGCRAGSAVAASASRQARQRRGAGCPAAAAWAEWTLKSASIQRIGLKQRRARRKPRPSSYVIPISAAAAMDEPAAEGSSMVRRRRGRTDQGVHRRNARTAFAPPNAKEFEMATSISQRRAALGT
jgi:hypothetical protein